MTWLIGSGGGIPLVLTWLYFMCWSAYGIEVVATFGPSSTTRRRTRRRPCARRRCSAPRSTRCCRSASAARSAPTRSPRDSTLIAFYSDAFNFDPRLRARQGHDPRPSAPGLVLSMNTATMDGSRALYGIAKDGMTIRQLGTLNRYHVPAVAMTIDAILNLLLITRYGVTAGDPGGEQRGLRLRDVYRALGLRPPTARPARLATAGAAARTGTSRSGRCWRGSTSSC